jgi:hypothetical protein
MPLILKILLIAGAIVALLILFIGAPLVPLTLKDGTELHPELQVIDEYGKVYHLSGLTLIGSLVGFGAKFPRDRTYTGVKIRSDQAFRCSKVYWDCSRLK